MSTRAACEGQEPALFFGEQHEGITVTLERVAAAKALCAACPVSLRCLSEAVAYESGQVDGFTHEPTGIWGGMTPSERKHMIAATRCCAGCGVPIARAENRRYCEPCAVRARSESKARYAARHRADKAAYIAQRRSLS